MQVKFAVPISTCFVPYDKLKHFWLTAEKLGYDHLFYQDHLFGRFSIPDGTQRIYECWTLLSGVAATTSTIRLGTEMACNSFRSPGLLAKMASTLDHMSNGRLELGLGVGWDREEHLAYGFPFPSYRERCDRLGEAVQVIKRLWTEEKASFHGRFYRIEAAYCEPKPLQKPHPSIMIGGSGNRLLTIAAEQADSCHLFSHVDYSKKLRFLQNCYHQARRGPGDLKRTLGTSIRYLARSEEEADSRLREMAKKKGWDLEEAKNNLEGSLYGTAEECISKIKGWVRDGFDRFSIDFPDMPLTHTLRQFAEEILPEFQTS